MIAFLMALALTQEVDALLQRTVKEQDPDCLGWIAQRLCARMGAQELGKLIGAIDKVNSAARPTLIQTLATFGQPATGALRKLVSKHDLPSRVTAARALAELGCGDGIVKLLGEMRSADEKALLLSILDRRRPGLSIVPVRAWVSVDQAVDVRRGAMAAIVVFEDEEGLAAIEGRAADASDPLRYTARAMLAAAGRDRAIDGLRAELEAGTVPAEALDDVLAGLGASRRSRAAEAFAESLRREKDPGRKAAFVCAIPRFEGSPAAMYIDQLVTASEPEVRAAAEEVALQVPERVAIATLKKLLAHGDAGRRMRAAEALLLRDDGTALPAITEASKSQDPAARRSAYRALGKARLRECIEVALTGLTDPDAGARCLAEQALAATLSAQFPYRVFDTAMAGYSPLLGSDDARAKGAQRLAKWCKEHVR
ncbi:MAG: HEAT repeat domain-containing protein [Planctomycetes bacterium]|nr:HEAT repeat domain-containing protein [Planctomycetota bacterium]